LLHFWAATEEWIIAGAADFREKTGVGSSHMCVLARARDGAVCSQVVAGASWRIQRTSTRRFPEASGRWLPARSRPCVSRPLRTACDLSALRSPPLQSEIKF
jgi:hypothetical protein